MSFLRLLGLIFLMTCPMLQAVAAPSLILGTQDVYSVNKHFDWVETSASVVDYQSAVEHFDSAQDTDRWHQSWVHRRSRLASVKPCKSVIS